jgi:hypothetical protein
MANMATGSVQTASTILMVSMATHTRASIRTLTAGDEMTDQQVYILAAAIVISGFLIGGIYDISAGQFGSYKINKFTGTVSQCSGGGCQ